MRDHTVGIGVNQIEREWLALESEAGSAVAGAEGAGAGLCGSGLTIAASNGDVFCEAQLVAVEGGLALGVDL